MALWPICGGLVDSKNINLNLFWYSCVVLLYCVLGAFCFAILETDRELEIRQELDKYFTSIREKYGMSREYCNVLIIFFGTTFEADSDHLLLNVLAVFKLALV